MTNEEITDSIYNLLVKKLAKEEFIKGEKQACLTGEQITGYIIIATCVVKADFIDTSDKSVGLNADKITDVTADVWFELFDKFDFQLQFTIREYELIVAKIESKLIKHYLS